MALKFESISETALWVAMHRAHETDRPDAHFRDPLARVLAGPRGEEIMRKAPYARQITWSTIVRTCVMDEILLRLLQQENLDCVVNLAAGLDARPYRLGLPPGLRWIEADFPAMIDYKEEALRNERPVCNLERVRVDLSDESARLRFFADVSSRCRNALVITEGLLVYLKREQVVSLGRTLAAQPWLQWWLSDLAAPVLIELARKRMRKSMISGGFEMQFGPEEGPDFFRPLGWTPVEFRSMTQEARRLDRQMPLPWLAQLIFRVLYGKEKGKQFERTGMILLKK